MKKFSRQFWAAMIVIDIACLILLCSFLFFKVRRHFQVKSAGAILAAGPDLVQTAAASQRKLDRHRLLPSKPVLRIPVEIAVSTAPSPPAPAPEKIPARLMKSSIKEEAGQSGKTAKKSASAGKRPAKRQSPPAGKVQPKAVKRVLIYPSPHSRLVQVSGSFSAWKPRQMKEKAGTWYIELFLFPGVYRYHFIADGKKVLDPGEPAVKQGESVLAIGPYGKPAKQAAKKNKPAARTAVKITAKPASKKSPGKITGLTPIPQIDLSGAKH